MEIKRCIGLNVNKLSKDNTIIIATKRTMVKILHGFSK